ncbi:tetratricopeptide repeat protein [bacterium]|nr:tetratricopeptide repeat protein [bacterium]
MKKCIAVIIFLAMGIIAYSNIYNNELVFDDVEIISHNEVIKDISNIRKILTTNYWHEQANAGLYRPLVYLSFALDYALWQDNHVGYHFFNILFHLLTCALIFVILKFFIKDNTAVLLSTIIFAVHPVHSEAVTGIVGRAEVFSAFFFCMGWILFLKSFCSPKKQLIFYAGSLLAYFLSLASKENSIVLPLVLFISGLYLNKQKVLEKKWMIRVFLYAMVFVVYFVIRVSVLGTIGPAGTEQFFYGKNLSVVFFSMIRAFAWYFKLLFVPTNLVCSYRHWELSHTLFDVRVIVSLIPVIGFVVCSLLFFKSRKTYRFFLLFILVTLLPVSNIIKFGDLMAERFLYLPSIGFCGFFVILFNGLLKNIKILNHRKKYIFFWLIVINLFLIALTVRNAQWRDGIIFWKTTIKDMPGSYSAYYNLGSVYYEKGAKNKAFYCMKKSLEINPYVYQTKKMCGILLYETGKNKKAVPYLKNLIAERPDDQDLYENLALSYLAQADYQNALSACREGLDKSAKKNNIFYTAVRIYLNLNKPDEALKIALNAVDYDSKDAKAYTKTGICYMKLGKVDEAVHFFQTAISLDKKNLEAIDNLAEIYFKQQNYKRAVQLWEKAIKLYPSRDYFWYYIGLALEKQNNAQAALTAYKKVQLTLAYKDRADRKIKSINNKINNR